VPFEFFFFSFIFEDCYEDMKIEGFFFLSGFGLEEMKNDEYVLFWVLFLFYFLKYFFNLFNL